MEKIGFFERRRVPCYDDPRQIAWGSVTVSSACTGCTLCMRICPANCLRMVGKRAEMGAGDCLMCGCCAAICHKGAITCISGYRFGGMFKTIDHGVLEPPRL